MVSYDLLLLGLKIENTTRGTKSMPFSFSDGIICGSGSFAGQFGDHFWSGDHLRSGIICGAVQNSNIQSSTDKCVFRYRQ